MRNKDLVAANISEAKEQLDELLRDLESDPEFSEIELRISLEHAYHHLNYAWHIRNVDPKRAAECSAADYKEWSKFPVKDIGEYE